MFCSELLDASNFCGNDMIVVVGLILFNWQVKISTDMPGSVMVMTNRGRVQTLGMVKTGALAVVV